MFRLDEDLRRFYTLCRKRGAPWTQVTRGLGRLLRSPNLFEDIVKTICTTNIQWSGTRRIVAGLVNEFGELAIRDFRDVHPESIDGDGVRRHFVRRPSDDAVHVTHPRSAATHHLPAGR